MFNIKYQTFPQSYLKKTMTHVIKLLVLSVDFPIKSNSKLFHLGLRKRLIFNIKHLTFPHTNHT